MASTPTPLLKFEQQGSGEHNDTWGDNLNSTLAMIENAIAKRAAIATTGGDTTLTDTQFVDNQARCSAIDVSGILASNANIIVPARTKPYIVRNDTTGSFTVTVKTASGSGVTVNQGDIAFVWCDGTNVEAVGADSSTLGGFPAADYARLAATNVWTAGNRSQWVGLTDGATITIDTELGNVFGVVLGGDRTIAFSNEADGAEVELYLTQDSTGGRLLTWPNNIIWEGGAAPTLSTAANAVDKVVLRYRAGSVNAWYGTVSRNLTTGGGSTIADITVNGSGSIVDVYALAGEPGSAVTFTFRLAAGTVLQSTCTRTPALDFSGFAAGSVITIDIGQNAYVIGAGGRGGNGASFDNDDNDSSLASPGEAGGPAIRLPSTACTITIINNGHIWGGGGGGGGGGAASADVSWGGAGGGGAGGGAPGNSESATLATRGSAGRLGAGGAGGSGGGSSAGGAGGAGGAYGAAGSAGTSSTGGGDSGSSGAGGAGGAAGKAIDYNGGSTPTYSVTGDIEGATS
jgi:hypothetical protein